MRNPPGQWNKRSAKQLLAFLHLAENLKNEFRHSRTSRGRRESVAEHVWRTALMAILLKPASARRLNWERLLAMIIIHDLAEARTGDVPIFDAVLRGDKKASEKKAMREFQRMLPRKTGQWLYDLWNEYESQKTPEAKFANALDKLEAQLQHNEADLRSWIEWEKVRIFGGLDAVASTDKTVRDLKDAIVSEAIQKLRQAGEDIGRLRKKARHH